MSMFSAPATTQGIDWAAHKGHLLLVSPLAQEEEMKTVHGDARPIRANVVDLDTGEEMDDILVFPRVLVSQLKPKIGEKVLGRLGQGVAKGGNNPPWILTDFSSEDEAKATAWITKQAKPAFSSPSDDGAPF